MTPDVFLFLSAFLASAVEMVEALTIVLAVGVTRGWRSALVGVGAALLALAALVGLLLTTFGTFWAAEGAGASWPGDDAALPAILAFLALASFFAVRALRDRHGALAGARA